MLRAASLCQGEITLKEKVSVIRILDSVTKKRRSDRSPLIFQKNKEKRGGRSG